MLSFIDTMVIPFLDHLYAAVGYLGVFFAMFVESTLLPLPSELILPFAGKAGLRGRHPARPQWRRDHAPFS